MGDKLKKTLIHGWSNKVTCNSYKYPFYNLINNPKMFNGETDDLAAKPYIPQKKLL